MTYGPPPTRGSLVINSHSIFSVGAEVQATASSTGASATWPAANRAIIIPFYLPIRSTLTKIFWVNGSAVSGNCDAGVYDAAYAKLVSSGSTAQSGTSAIQIVDVTDTVLAPGTYYMALAIDNTTATTLRGTSGNLLMRTSGLADMASAFALPATFTPAALTSPYVPYMGVTFRTLTGSP